MRAAILAVSLASFLTSGCFLFKKQRDVYAEAKPAADELRTKLVAAAKLIDKHEEPTEDEECSESKKLTFDPKSDAHDTDYIMLQEAKRGGGKPDDENPDEKLDLKFSGPFVNVMAGTSPNSPYTDYAVSGIANEDMKKNVKRGLQVKNVVIVRERSSSMDYFLVDLAKDKPKIVCAGSFQPNADPNAAGPTTKEYVKITKNKKTGKVISKEKLTSTSDAKGASLWADARKQLAERMESELGLSAP
jgi:hypothetical protein